jgi:RNA polymerase sigma-54 factor
MALEIKQGLKTTQKLSLSAELKHSITILTLGRSELEKFISDELEKNPCLVGIPKQQENEHFQHYEEMKRALQNSYNQTDYTERYNDIKSNEEISSSSHKREYADVTLSNSLHSFIEEQISVMRLSQYEKECVLTILQYIDDNGFLNTDIKSISESHSLHLDDLKFALETIQKCDPTGIGANNLQECLQLQFNKLEKKPKYVENLLTKYWIDFQKQNFLKIARQEKTSIDEIKNAFRFIKTHFDPKPARQFGPYSNQVIIPDIYVFKRDGKWICSANENGLPRLKLSKKYSKILTVLKSEMNLKQSKETYKYINENIKSAKWLVKSLKERDKTIIKVVESIIKHQEKFFENGVEYLTPLTLKVVAQELELHESTISRATSDKYLHSPRGIYELKYFFNTAVENNSGKELANETIKQFVAEFIKNENKENPLSDQEITEKIELNKGIKIARRTVAKYRESLGIMSSSKRTQRF